ncbi:MAG: hypothetical protein MUC34_13265 [Anaerolineae bacterium]|jgi:hypothetical protein|nr:hypothetical protein [Anaerolineae bacterium]
MNPETGPVADAPSGSGEWECMECGFVIEGVLEHRPAKCPDCGAPAQALEFFSDEGDGHDGWDVPATERPYDEDAHNTAVNDDDKRLP